MLKVYPRPKKCIDTKYNKIIRWRVSLMFFIRKKFFVFFTFLTILVECKRSEKKSFFSVLITFFPAFKKDSRPELKYGDLKCKILSNSTKFTGF